MKRIDKGKTILLMIFVAFLLQVVTSIELILAVTQEPYGLKAVAHNGVELMQKIDATHGEYISIPPDVRSLLISYHTTLDGLTGILLDSGETILVCSLVQIAGVLFIWKRLRTAS